MKTGLTLLIGVTVGACTGSSAAESFAVPDSAGIEVVVTTVPAWDSGGSWVIGPDPTVTIGASDGRPEYLFGDVRGVVLTADRQIAVADGLSQQVRYFDERGVHLRTVGGPGDGPGEFRSLWALELCDGSLHAFDVSNGRVSVWSSDGELVETFQLVEPGSTRRPYRNRCGPGGEYVMAGWGDPVRHRPGTRFSLYAQVAPVWVTEPPTGDATRIGDYVSSERIYSVNPVTGGTGSGPHPFGRRVVFASDGTHLFIGRSERLQIEQRALDGSLIRILRGPDLDLSISSDLIARYRAAEMIRPDSLLRDRLEENDMRSPPSAPAYDHILLDPDGNIWMRRFHAWSPNMEWGVFAASGRFLGHVGMPAGFSMFAVDTDLVLGVSEDDLGVERVVVHPLITR